MSTNKLSEKEKANIPVCKTHQRNERTARLAIKTIIWDMILSNDKVLAFMRNQPKSKPKPKPAEPVSVIYSHCIVRGLRLCSAPVLQLVMYVVTSFNLVRRRWDNGYCVCLILYGFCVLLNVQAYGNW